MMIALLILLPSCAPPPSIVTRRTALVPAAHPAARTGSMLTHLEAEVSFSATAMGPGPLGATGEEAPRVRGPGLLLPNLELAGAATVGLVHHLELGVQGRFADSRWSRRNTRGVLPFPEPQRLLQAGGHLRSGFWYKDLLYLTLGLEGAWLSLPQATYRCELDFCALELDGQEAMDAYRLDGVRQHDFIVAGGAVETGVRVGDYLIVFLQVSGMQSFSNIGFEPESSTQTGSTLTTYFITSACLGIQWNIGLFSTRILLLYPLMYPSSIRQAPAFGLFAGLRFPLSVHASREPAEKTSKTGLEDFGLIPEEGGGETLDCSAEEELRREER